MTFDWTEYLNLAQELAGQATKPASKEARLRSSVSRAYYATFCEARNHLRDVEGHSILSTGEVHGYVRDEFKNSADRLKRQIGINLDRLRVYRNKVDYDDSVTGLSSMVTMSLKLARKIISALRTL
jgi:uncharacterized protein (UPF0332 family)